MKNHLLFIAAIAMTRIASGAEPADEFEQIARQAVEIVPGLEANPAPKLPDTVLPWEARFTDGFAPAGKGEWKQISIPHYWGPIYEAASYYRTTVKLDARMLDPESLYRSFASHRFTAGH